MVVAALEGSIEAISRIAVIGKRESSGVRGTAKQVTPEHTV